MTTNDPLLSPAALERLTREHDLLTATPQKPPYEWKYHEYFAPSDQQPHTTIDVLAPQRAD